jgi:hypothetical protein
MQESATSRPRNPTFEDTRLSVRLAAKKHHLKIRLDEKPPESAITISPPADCRVPETLNVRAMCDRSLYLVVEAYQ